MATCVCGNTRFRPREGVWVCRECGAETGHVRPFKRVRDAAAQWYGNAHWDRAAIAFREQTLREAREWANEYGGTVAIQVYRRPELRVATIHGF